MAHTTRNPVLNNGKPTVVYLAGSLSSSFQEGVARGVSERAKELDYNVIVLAGGPLNSPDPLALTRETLFNLVDPDVVDGIIIPVSSHTRFLDETETQAFVDKFSQVPIVNVGSIIEGMLNIIANYETGLASLIEHLVKDHKYKRIALMRGPKNHETSNLRQGIFEKILKQNNTPFYEDLVFYTDINKDAAIESFTPFIEKRKGDFDVIVATNDNVATGVIEALKSKGISVPEDVAVTGSLNSPVATFSDPQLTSIEEPRYDLGRAAVSALNDIFEGRDGRDRIDVEIPTSLVIRQSCGCSSINVEAPHKKYDREESEIDEIYKYGSDILVLNKCTSGYRELRALVELYRKGIEQKEMSPFLVALKTQLNSVMREEDVIAWISIISEFQHNSITLFETYLNETYLEDFISIVIKIKEEISLDAMRYMSVDTDFYINNFRQISIRLNSSFDLKKIKGFALEVLGLSELYISIYDDAANSLDSAYNMMAVRDREFFELSEREKPFKSRKLIPQRVSPYSERFSLIVLPLSFRKKPLGFMVTDFSKRKGTAFENMHSIISTALKNELQIQDLKRAEERFSDIAHSTSNWLWETDENHTFIYSSESVHNVLGYTDKEMIGIAIDEFVLPDSGPFYECMLSKERFVNSECWFRHKSGKVVCLLISAKPIVKEERFIGYRGVFKDITEQKLQEEKINNLAYSDMLTGLPNRAMFHEKLEYVISNSKAQDQKFALIFLDLDRFKYINDSMGHSVGDQLLKSFSNVLKSATRSNDTIARLGGDEFTLILPDIKSDTQVIQVAKRILEKLETPIILNKKQAHITVSLGISIFPADGKDSETLLKTSDNAMYQAKSQGRNRYVFYDKFIEEKNSLRNQNEEILHRAISDNRFVLYYQPQVDSITGAILGMEALVRINDKERGIISPGSFIPLAEELGLIGKIDEWVLEEACSQHHRWIERGYGARRISINLSAIQLKNRNVVNKYLNILERHGVPPKSIVLEITENSLIENEEMAMEIIQDFKDSGVSVALDDFGTGFSSLRCINLYPFEIIKIDRSFVKGSVVNSKNLAIIKSILLLAKSLNLKIVAEGVETPEQYELMKSLECDEIQGYYFFKPLEREQIEYHFAHKAEADL